MSQRPWRINVLVILSYSSLKQSNTKYKEWLVRFIYCSTQNLYTEEQICVLIGHDIQLVFDRFWIYNSFLYSPISAYRMKKTKFLFQNLFAFVSNCFLPSINGAIWAEQVHQSNDKTKWENWLISKFKRNKVFVCMQVDE